jgi:hypothetical protein
LRYTFGFKSGVGPRVVMATAWLILAVLVVLILDRRDSPSIAASPSTHSEQIAQSQDRRSLEITLQAGFRVEGWTVMVGGREVEAQSTGEATWKGSVTPQDREGNLEFFVEARAQDHFAQHRHALEVAIREGARSGQRTIWGDGDVSALIDVDELLAQ